jgi:NADH dehydrogenase
MNSPTQKHRIVIVGGGAGGLELATRLGDTLGKRGDADITLVDKNRTHVWKPKLHEIASGSMDMSAHEVDYLAQAHWHHFRFRVGEMTALDRERREVRVAAYHDSEGREVTPDRSFGYDTLVLALGSQSNDFGTPGVGAHALKLESKADARRFNERMVNACIRAHAQAGPLRPEQLHVAIIGAGATGVELAAELHRTTREVVAYGLDRVDAEKDIQVCLIEAAERVLPALPPRMSQATEGLLKKLGVVVHTSAKVSEVQAGGVLLSDGRLLPAELVVWAAGVKAAATSWWCCRRCRPRATKTSSSSATARPAPGPRPMAARVASFPPAPRPHTSRPPTWRGRSCAAWPAGRSSPTATATSARWSRSANSAPWAT